MIIKLYILVFMAGSIGMVYEFAGTRLLAPFYGDSMIIWTAIISTFLGSISIGYWVGGIMADKRMSSERLANLLTSSAFFAVLILYFNPIVLVWIKAYIENIYLSSLTAATILFAIPNIILGMIYPFAVQKSMQFKGFSVTNIGALSALSTIGSIAGTLLAGFVLIPHIGTTRMLYILPLALICMAIMLCPKKGIVLRIILALFIAKSAMLPSDTALAIVFNKESFKSIDSQYGRYLLFNGERNGRKTINLSNDPFTIQSIKYIDDRSDFLIEGTYGDYFQLADYFQNNAPKNVLMLGAGGFVFPSYYNNTHPNVNLDIVEIDPILSSIAKQYFGYQPSKNVSLYIDDARQYLKKTEKKYDVVFMDVFNSQANIPFHLTTTEYFNELSSKLTVNGLLVFNVVSAVTGNNSRLYQSLGKTLKPYFPQLYMFPVENIDKSTKTQNIIIIAEKNSTRKTINKTGDEKIDALLNSYLPIVGDFKEGITLTDDFAPTQYMVAFSK